MKRTFITIIFALLSLAAFSQPQEVKLLVRDKAGNPLAGVLVSAGGGEAAATAADGTVLVVAEKGEKLSLVLPDRFSRSVSVTSTDMTIVLGDNDVLLGRGFGIETTKRNSALAADGIALSEAELSTGSDDQLLSSMFGVLPGLQLYSSGTGSWPETLTPVFKVRGAGSCTNGTLFIVDGVPRDPATIDFNEVQSVSVLKDAAALAIYGIRGADGAVCVTTKRGGPSKIRAKVAYDFGLQTPYGMPEMADAGQYARALNEARYNDGLAPYFSDSDVKGIEAGTNKVIPVTLWRNLILRDVGYKHNANVSLDGSTSKARYFVYADFKSRRGFFDNTRLAEGISCQDEYTGLKIRSNLDVNVTKSTDLIINLGARLQQGQMPYYFSGLDAMYNTPVVGLPVKYNNLWVGSDKFQNPLSAILGRGNGVTFQRMLSGDVTIRQDFSFLTKGLKAEVRVAYDNSADIYDAKSYSTSYYNAYPVYDDAGNLSDYNYLQYGNDTEIEFNSYLSAQYMQFNLWGKLSWERTFGKHGVNVAALFNREKRTLAGANNSRVYHDAILAADYNFAGKYIVNAVFSASAGSVLPKGDKYRYYPAVSAGWLVSEEDFLRNARHLDLLKIRASYGLSGMDRNLAYDMDKQFNGGGNGYIFVSPTVSSGSAEGALPSSGIQPETDTKINAGFELGLFGGLTAEVDLFHNTRSHIRTVAANSVSEVVGIGLSDTFTGEMVNRGVEASLGWAKNVGKLRWYLKGNFSFVRNKITNIEEVYSPYDYMYLQGHSLNSFYGLVADGYYQKSDFDAAGKLVSGLPDNTFTQVQAGDVKYRDLNGDGRIDNYDFCYHDKSTDPEFYYGFRLGLEYAGFGFNAFFQGAGGNVVITNLPSVYQPLYGNDKNVSSHYLESYWSESHPDGRYPRLTTLENSNNYLSSDLWTEKGGYLKLREAELYWSMPEKVAAKMKMKGARVYLRGSNLFCVDKVKIFDPEYVSLGYPPARVYSIGFNMTF
ncbi:MAG: SusC/RagA family TonB-linked outer membrane protein [Bacteroidales bacterium]|nr:SusC/RagA family TonB-linked outer membrane protein [Bacteroidales bacterium]